jgi:hypothetical protein
MQLVSTVTVGAGGASSIEFTSIPQTGTDLVLVLSARVTDSTGNSILRLNNDTSASNYSQRALSGNGSAASSFASTFFPDFMVGNSALTATTFGNLSVYIPNYTSSVAKSISMDNVLETNSATAFRMLEIKADRWAGTNAINRITLVADSGGNYVENTTASLYIITKA